MEPFLHRLAHLLLERHGKELDQVCVVLPGKRSGTYLRKYLAGLHGRTQWSPALYDVGSFLSKVAQMRQGGSLEMLFTLYDAQLALRGNDAEALEELLLWAPTALRDMSELDAHALDLDLVYRELKSYYELEDWAQGLGESPAQMRSGTHWRQMGLLHRTLQQHSKAQRVGTSGAVAREAMERLESGTATIPWKAVWFAGLNALEPATTRAIKALQAKDMAYIAWDSDEHYAQAQEQEAGTYLRRSVAALGPGLIPPSNGIRSKERHFIHAMVPNAIAQATHAASLLAEQDTEERAHTAVVLADEALLMPLMAALPKDIGPINVTMGMPLETLPIHGLTEAFLSLHAGHRTLGMYALADIERLLLHPFLEQAGQTAKCLAKLRGLQRTRFSAALLIQELEQAGMELFPEIRSALEPIVEVSTDLPMRMIDLLAWGQRMNAHDRYRTEQLFQMAKLQIRADQGLQRMGAVLHDVDTYRSLRKKLLREERIAFIGEPLHGLQIMGVLETRAIDHERIILLGASEGTLPRTGQQQTYIPFSVRRSLRLPMRSDAEAISAYHFQRMAQHTSHLELVHGAGEGPGCGEPSRFILQWQYELQGASHTRFSTVTYAAPFHKRPVSGIAVAKDERVLERFAEICRTGLSPSAMAMWLRCPLDFYFSKALGIRNAEGPDGRLGSDVLGEAVHGALEAVIRPLIGNPMDPAQLEQAAKSTLELLHAQLSGTFPEEVLSRGNFRLRLEMAARAMQRHLLSEALRCSKETSVVLDLELPMEAELRPGVLVKGRIDRIEVRDGVHHILDLKTGTVDASKLKVTELDRSQFTSSRSQALQLLVYAWLYLTHNPKVQLVRAGILPIQKSSEAQGLFVHVARISDIHRKDMPAIERVLEQLVDELMDPAEPLVHTRESSYCTACLTA